jgi:hypothetical protein
MKNSTQSFGYGHGLSGDKLEQVLVFPLAGPMPELKAMTLEEILAEVDAEM